MNEIRSVAVFLGPYRNLTTLTASILALHPHCQVLNHGKDQVFTRPIDNFFTSDDKGSLDRFIAAALELSEGGERGDKGGSITLSHAFDHDVMREEYTRRFGDRTRKELIHSLVWKESLRASNAIHKHSVDLSALFARHPRLRFVMPIRNPLDSALSNLKTGHHRIFREMKNPDLPAVLEAVLREIAWFLEQQESFPERFFCYYQNELDEAVLKEFAAFLELDADEEWIRAALNCYRLKPPYEHAPKIHTRYRELVDQLIRREDSRQRLLTLVS